jgi:hypothetical protein
MYTCQNFIKYNVIYHFSLLNKFNRGSDLITVHILRNDLIYLKGLNTLLVPRIWKLYFFLPRVWKVTKLVIVVLKNDQVSPSVS